MIKVANVYKSYGAVAAVKDISFEVAKGENFVLLGTSGCGKTTTLKMINRLVPVSSGTISVNGKNITEQPAEKLRRGIGYVLQHSSLFPHYTIAQNIAIVPQLLDWNKSRIQSRTSELLEKLHLPQACLSKYPDQLSGGEAQRVNVARALAADPPILLMDEPFGALDPVTRVDIRKQFSELEVFKQKTIVMVTHDVQEAFELADRICIMNGGEIMQVGTPSELLFKPANDFVRNFLADTYLPLSLATVKISNLWPHLPKYDETHPSGKIFNSDTNLHKVLEYLMRSNDVYVTVEHKDEGSRNIMAAALLQAFTVYKNIR
jgi:osmoprotectant transport system ATP-binding protein